MVRAGYNHQFFVVASQFLEGIRKIEEGVKLGYVFVLMCAEKRPEVCHRCIMIARQFYLRGYEIRHILEDGTYINQNSVEQILLNKYFPNRNQLSLFDGLSIQEMIEQWHELDLQFEKNQCQYQGHQSI